MEPWEPDDEAGEALERHLELSPGPGLEAPHFPGAEGRSLGNGLEDTEDLARPGFCFTKVRLAGGGRPVCDNSVLLCLKKRFHLGRIYTFGGPLLLALNPCRPLPLFSPEVLANYHSAKALNTTPYVTPLHQHSAHPPGHIFAVAAAAYSLSQSTRQGSCILLGGSGKTEAAKRIALLLSGLQREQTGGSRRQEGPSFSLGPGVLSSGLWLLLRGSPRCCLVCAWGGVRWDWPLRGPAQSPGTGCLIVRHPCHSQGYLNAPPIQLNDVLRVLSSFGHAKTVLNANASRFGQVLCLGLQHGVIWGVSVSHYLLETSRVVFQAQAERSFHVLYELLAGLDPVKREQLSLQGPETFYYLNQGQACRLQGKEDAQDFSGLLKALQALGLCPEELTAIWAMLAAILHLGNICFSSTERESQEVAAVSSWAEIHTWSGLSPGGSW
ncbi:Unconventional Myosin-Xv [Manis pentadactyla]|nr:Unconventional Myosin-Xv [Manis pentadactyla]